MYVIPAWFTFGSVSSMPNQTSAIRALTIRSEQEISGAFLAPRANKYFTPIYSVVMVVTHLVPAGGLKH